MRILIILLLSLLCCSYATADENEGFWTEGDLKLIKSSGTTVTAIWSEGVVEIRHEYTAVADTPKGWGWFEDGLGHTIIGR